MNRPINNNGQANGLSQDQDNILLRTLFWNADGLTSDKFTEFKRIVIKNNIDFYAIAEAGASTDNEKFFQLNGYQTYALRRSRVVASGLLLAVKTAYTVRFRAIKAMNVNDKLEMAEMEIWKKGIHRKFLIAYNPPRNAPDLRCLENEWDRHCVLMGDLNAHSRLWGYSDTSQTGKIFEDFIASNPVQFIENDNSSPTFLSYRGRTSHPDVVLAHTAISSTIRHNLLPSPSGFGHKILSVDLAHQSKLSEKIPHNRMKWNFKKANWKLYTELAEQLLAEVRIDENIDASFSRIKEAIIKAAKKAIPRGKVKRYSPFWTEELQLLKEERDKARDIVERTGSVEDRQVLKVKTANLRRCIVDSKKKAYRTFLKDLDFRRDGIEAHRFISKLNNDSGPKKKNPFLKGDKLLTSDNEIAKYFCNHYAKISNFVTRNARPEKKIPLTCPTEEEMPLMYADFDIWELNLALQETKSGKSPGPDGIHPEFLTNLGDNARKTSLIFLNRIWKSYYPSEWRKAEVIPIPKKDKELNVPANFRPISLTSVFSKVFERMVLRRLQLVIDKNGSLSNRQAGFRKHRGSIEQVARLAQEIKDGFQRKQSSLAVFIDFRTAFDRVWRRKLLSKLQDHGIKGNLFKSISSFLAQRYIRVRYNDTVSPFKQTKHGLPQGSVISPTLFNLMINDVIAAVQSIPGVQSLLYADDLVIWATSSNINALEKAMNEALNCLSIWSKENELIVNPEKSEFQLFTLSTKQYTEISLVYDSEHIRRTNNATYLGVQLDTKLQWSKHVDKLVRNGTKRLGLLKRLTGTKWGTCESVLTQTYTAYVRPVMEYGSELITTSSKKTLEKLDKTQNQALRLITGGPLSTPITAMELQTGVDPLTIRRDLAAVSLNERVFRLGIDYWKNYKPPNQRLKTQKSISGKALDLAAMYNLNMKDRIDFPASKVQINPPGAIGRLDLLNPVKNKAAMLPAELKANALETIFERYPLSGWLHIYTDGSAIDAQGNGGAGVYSQAFQISEPVGSLASNFDGEVRAILLALIQLKYISGNQAVLFVDSQAAIQAITSLKGSESADVIQSRATISELIAAEWTIILQWIPSHCGISGNEEADRLAKEGSQKPQPQVPLEYDTAKRIIRGALKDAVKRRHESGAEGKRWSSLLQRSGRLPHDLPRSEAVACFRMLTGHDYLQAHLHRIGIVDSSSCVLCGSRELMTGDHLNDCEALADLQIHGERDTKSSSKLYWAARRRMMLNQNGVAL